MGIVNNRNNIVNKVREIGTYHRQARNYKVYVDGELMWWKGVIGANLSKHCCEEPIAATACEYLDGILRKIRLKMNNRAWDSVTVFMDGARVENKVRRAQHSFNCDVSLVRKLFKEMCICSSGYEVVQLVYGESELQMYLNRDQLCGLNILVTGDSDMISICYDHMPKIYDVKTKTINEIMSELGETTNDDGTTTKKLSVVENFDFKTDTVHEDVDNYFECEIYDSNAYYDSTKYRVFDSCVWYDCSSSQRTMIGFDSIRANLVYNPCVFRTFIANCGTDFTSHLFTNSMAGGILEDFVRLENGTVYGSKREEREFINTLENASEITAALLFLTLRSNGIIIRTTTSSMALAAKFDPKDFDQSIEIYNDYIRSGRMRKENMPKVDMALLCRNLIYAMKNGSDNVFTKQALRTWATRITVEEAISNFRTFTTENTTPPIDKLLQKKQQSQPQQCIAGNSKKTKFTHLLRQSGGYDSDSELNAVFTLFQEDGDNDGDYPPTPSKCIKLSF